MAELSLTVGNVVYLRAETGFTIANHISRFSPVTMMLTTIIPSARRPVNMRFILTNVCISENTFQSQHIPVAMGW